MANFYIEKVMATGKGGKESVINFTPGMNLIWGQPNCGKSCVVRCINFLFGHNGEKDDPTHGSPFSVENTGYDCVKMRLVTPWGYVLISRKIGDTKIDVSTNIDGIKSTTYLVTKSKAKKPNPYINDVWMTLLGTEGNPEVFSNQEMSNKKDVTWKTLKQMFLIHEKKIISQTPIFFPEKFPDETYVIACLAYLLTGKDHIDDNVKVSKEIRKIGRKAIEAYIFEQMEHLRNRKEQIAKNMQAEDVYELECAIASAIHEMAEIEDSILRAADKAQIVFDRISEEDERLTERNVVLNRYKYLQNQYRTDIERLHFIEKSEISMANHRHVSSKCPVCETVMPVRNRKSYSETAKIEAARLVGQLADLTEAFADIEREIKEIESNISELNDERNAIQRIIDVELQPQKDALKIKIKAFQTAIQVQSELDSIDRAVKEMGSKLTAMSVQAEEDKGSTIKYLPKLHIGKEFFDTIDDYILEMLTECAYDSFASARFDIERFDICVDGKAKLETNFGKGYLAYLNTVLAFCVMRYLTEHGKYAPGILIADSPTVSFKNIGDESVSSRMKNGLYNYLIRHQQYGKFIIVENDIPSISLDGIKVHHFTKNINEGRYGFLNGVYK